MPPTDDPQLQPTSPAPVTPNLYPSQEEPPARKPSRAKLFWVIGTILIVTVFAILGSLLYRNYQRLKVTGSGKFEAVTYKNEAGETYHLSYYPDSSTTANLASLNGQVSDGQIFLEAAVPDNPNLPLAIHISKGEPSLNLQTNGICKLDQRFKLTTQTGVAILVCGVFSNGKQVVYLAELDNGSDKYLATLLLDYDFKQAVSSQQAASTAVAQVDLARYDSDIKSILSSVTFN